MHRPTVPLLALLSTCLLLLTACESRNPPSTSSGEKGAQPPAPVTEQDAAETGRFAFQKTCIAARSWAQDAKPVSLESQVTKAFTGQGGKAGVWRASFASASRQAMKAWTWSGVAAEDAPSRGINPGSEETFNPANTSTRPFDPAFLKIDSDAAFQTAIEHGGAAAKKDPGTTAAYLLFFDARQNQLKWRVTLDPAKSRPMTVWVDATSGKVLSK